MMMLAESSILGLVEIVGGVDRWFKLPFASQIGHGSQLPPAWHENVAGRQATMACEA